MFSDTVVKNLFRQLPDMDLQRQVFPPPGLWFCWLLFCSGVLRRFVEFFRCLHFCEELFLLELFDASRQTFLGHVVFPDSVRGRSSAPSAMDGWLVNRLGSRREAEKSSCTCDSLISASLSSPSAGRPFRVLPRRWGTNCEMADAVVQRCSREHDVCGLLHETNTHALGWTACATSKQPRTLKIDGREGEWEGGVLVG